MYFKSGKNYGTEQAGPGSDKAAEGT